MDRLHCKNPVRLAENPAQRRQVRNVSLRAKEKPWPTMFTPAITKALR